LNDISEELPNTYFFRRELFAKSGDCQLQSLFWKVSENMNKKVNESDDHCRIIPIIQTKHSLVFFAFAFALVELRESGDDCGLIVSTGHAVTKNGQEHGEVDWTRSFLDHRIQLGFRAQTTERVERLADIAFGNETILVLIDHLESLIQIKVKPFD
jgi:hypothetical protein